MELRLHVYETLWYLLVTSLCALHRRQSLCAGVQVLLQLKWGIAKGGIGRGGTREGGTREGGTGGSRTRGGGMMGGEVGRRKVGRGK